MLDRERKTKRTPPLAPNILIFLLRNTTFVKIKLLGNGEQSKTAVARAPCLVSLFPPERTRSWAQRRELVGLENGWGSGAID